MINNILYPILTSLPGRYAFALFQICKSCNNLNQVLDDFEKFDQCVSRNIKVSLNLRVSARDIILEVLSKQLDFSSTFKNFFKLVADNRRLKLMPKIKNIFVSLIRNEQKERDVTVKSATELNNEQKSDVKTLVSDLFGTNSVLSYEIDESLLSGITIYADGKMYDASGRNVMRQIENLCKSVKV